MKYFALLLAAAMAVSTSAAVSAEIDPLVKKLQDISVTIKAGGSQGSGVLFTRQEGDDTVSYVWTAAHVVDGSRSQRKVVINGSEKTIVEFKDVAIVQEFTQSGRRIGEFKMDAKVIRYSDADDGEDLALLEVRKRNFVPVSTTASFYLDEEIPPLGTELYHVGSLLGQVGANSLTTGIVSQIGRVLDLKPEGTVFDQTTVTAYPGSSGGGVFLKADGRYYGMLVRGAGAGFNFVVPARRIKAWAQTAKIEWAIDQSVALPSVAERSKLPVEDAGVVFQGAANYDAVSPKPHDQRRSELNAEFPFLLRYGNVLYDSLMNQSSEFTEPPAPIDFDVLPVRRPRG